MASNASDTLHWNPRDGTAAAEWDLAASAAAEKAAEEKAAEEKAAEEKAATNAEVKEKKTTRKSRKRLERERKSRKRLERKRMYEAEDAEELAREARYQRMWGVPPENRSEEFRAEYRRLKEEMREYARSHGLPPYPPPPPARHGHAQAVGSAHDGRHGRANPDVERR